MQELKVTDDLNEQVCLGKEIFKCKESFYSKKEVNRLKQEIEKAQIALLKNISEEDVFYIAIYNYWLYGVSIKEFIFYRFYELSHCQKEKYITYKNRYDFYGHMNDWNASHILNNKYETYELLKTDYGRDIVLLEKESDFEVFKQFVEKHPVFVFKPTCMGLAAGVQKIDVRGEKDLEKNFRKLLRMGKVMKQMNQWEHFENVDSVILEELIIQNEEFGLLHPESVNCIRIPTIYTEQEVYIFHPYFKIGNNGGYIVDERTGSVLAGIDVSSGIINTKGYDEHGNVYEQHPYSGIKIEGFQVPAWADAVVMAKRLAETMSKYNITYVGWDFVLTDEGWKIIEGNFDGELLGQLPEQKGHKKELEDILNWKPDKEYWWK